MMMMNSSGGSAQHDALADVYGFAPQQAAAAATNNGAAQPHQAAAAPVEEEGKMLRQMDEAMQVVPAEEKAAYMQALRLCPHLVKTESKVCPWFLMFEVCASPRLVDCCWVALPFSFRSLFLYQVHPKI